MVVLAEKEVAHLIHPIPKTKKTFSGEDARTQVPTLGHRTINKPRSGLRHGFTLSTTPGITEGVIDNQSFDMELVARRPLKNK